jgi:hypothetical protein
MDNCFLPWQPHLATGTMLCHIHQSCLKIQCTEHPRVCSVCLSLQSRAANLTLRRYLRRYTLPHLQGAIPLLCSESSIRCDWRLIWLKMQIVNWPAVLSRLGTADHASASVLQSPALQSHLPNNHLPCNHTCGTKSHQVNFDLVRLGRVLPSSTVVSRFSW